MRDEAQPSAVFEPTAAKDLLITSGTLYHFGHRDHDIFYTMENISLVKAKETSHAKFNTRCVLYHIRFRRSLSCQCSIISPDQQGLGRIHKLLGEYIIYRLENRISRCFTRHYIFQPYTPWPVSLSARKFTS